MEYLKQLIPKNALRNMHPDSSPHVTNMELFFDLVYVFAIIQLSHFLLAHTTLLGAVEALTLFAAVWWAWNYTAWSTNWLNPDHISGRLLMIVLMGCALLIAAALPQAFGERAGLFVGAYMTMALIRAAYMSYLFRGERMGQNYLQLGAWSALSGVFWVLGWLFDEARLVFWIMAVLVDYAAPYTGFWVPGKEPTPMNSWPLKGLHLFERNQLIFIIALGESILLLGAMLVEHDLHTDIITTGIIGFLLIVVLWWIYFVDLSEPGEHRFANERDHAELARAALAYAHGIMVCGAIVMAVAIEMMVAHPDVPIHGDATIIAFAGPTLFLLGALIFQRTMLDEFRLAYLMTISALGLWVWLAYTWHVTGFTLGGGVLTILVVSIIINGTLNKQRGVEK